jgi:hypothetical protein
VVIRAFVQSTVASVPMAYRDCADLEDAMRFCESAAACGLVAYIAEGEMHKMIIGDGGSGPASNRVPECPLCHCSGGGGHGGLCPNMGKSPAGWTSEMPAGYTNTRGE